MLKGYLVTLCHGDRIETCYTKLGGPMGAANKTDVILVVDSRRLAVALSNETQEYPNLCIEKRKL